MTEPMNIWSRENLMKVNGLAGDVSKLGDRCDLIYSDNVEKQKRIKNIVVRGLPESEDITDTDLVKEILTVLDIETTPTSCPVPFPT
jgi:hypothetical protein